MVGCGCSSWRHDVHMIAILSDIHGNRPALEAVMTEVQALGITRVVVLGDVVGYGPFPNDCLRMVAKAELNLQGNHEAGIVGRIPESWFNDVALEMIQWTRRKLTGSDRSLIQSWKSRGSLEGMQFAHASLNPHNEFDYLLTPRALAAHFAVQTAPVCFVGHTHLSAIWQQGREAELPIPKDGLYDLAAASKTVVNVGSVGLPRGEDKRAAWATYDSSMSQVHFRRTPYDIDETIRTIRHLHLDPILETKLLRDLGLKVG